jgi:hypothetical protein
MASRRRQFVARLSVLVAVCLGVSVVGAAPANAAPTGTCKGPQDFTLRARDGSGRTLTVNQSTCHNKDGAVVNAVLIVSGPFRLVRVTYKLELRSCLNDARLAERVGSSDPSDGPLVRDAGPVRYPYGVYATSRVSSIYAEYAGRAYSGGGLSQSTRYACAA